MADRRLAESKQLKKDSMIRREVRDDIAGEIVQANVAPRYSNPNRDQARGDWDRSGRHADEGASRDEGTPDDQERPPQE